VYPTDGTGTIGGVILYILTQTYRHCKWETY
jgi:hypothetical protein